MPRLRKLPMAMVVFFASLLLAPSFAKTSDPIDREVGKIKVCLDQLEKKFPADQALIFKIRIAVKTILDIIKAPQPDLSPRRASVMNGLDADLDRVLDMYDGCAGLKDKALRDKLQAIVSCQTPIGYQGAQSVIFERLDNFDGQVECVYTGRKLATTHEPPATNMNIEHTWPQSQGAVGDAKCDLNHLFPTDSKANNLRGSFPFGNVKSVKWEEGGSKFDGSRFQVRKEHCGDTARAKFYFAVRYGKSIPSEEEAALRQWSKDDPVDAFEKNRNDKIENIQHNRNCFIDHPEFIDAISDF